MSGTFQSSFINVSHPPLDKDSQLEVSTVSISQNPQGVKMALNGFCYVKLSLFKSNIVRLKWKVEAHLQLPIPYLKFPQGQK